jgi:uncharacterized cupredoxin-like copper-binding protein
MRAQYGLGVGVTADAVAAAERDSADSDQEEGVMSTTTDAEAQQPTPELADEVHELADQEAALERRTRALELSGPLALILSIFALALGIGALVVALTNDADQGAGAVVTGAGAATPGTMMGSGASRGMMMGAGDHGSFTFAQVAAGARGTVYVQLGDYWAAPAVSSVRAGKVTFKASNVGRVPHELMIERAPIKFDAPMRPNEDAAQGMIDDMAPGRSGQMTMQLRPGTYMLFCNVNGHYAAGQHILFRVTAS